MRGVKDIVAWTDETCDVSLMRSVDDGVGHSQGCEGLTLKCHCETTAFARNRKSTMLVVSFLGSQECASVGKASPK